MAKDESLSELIEPESWRTQGDRAIARMKDGNIGYALLVFPAWVDRLDALEKKIKKLKELMDSYQR